MLLHVFSERRILLHVDESTISRGVVADVRAVAGLASRSVGHQRLSPLNVAWRIFEDAAPGRVVGVRGLLRELLGLHFGELRFFFLLEDGHLALGPLRFRGGHRFPTFKSNIGDLST